MKRNIYPKEFYPEDFYISFPRMIDDEKIVEIIDEPSSLNLAFRSLSIEETLESLIMILTSWLSSY